MIVLMLVMAIAGHTYFPPLYLWEICGILAIPQMIVTIINAVKNSKISKLDDDYLPHFDEIPEDEWPYPFKRPNIKELQKNSDKFIFH